MTSRAQLIRFDISPRVEVAFSTRYGGVSPAPWESLNLGKNVTDLPKNVAENRRLVAAELRTPVVYMQQVHGTAIASIGVDRDEDEQIVDGLVTTQTGLSLAVLVADCVPLLLADPEAGVIAAVHAGRRGVAENIVLSAISAMAALEAEPERVIAVVGPSICGTCYEVSKDIYDEMVSQLPQAASRTRDLTFALDLPKAISTQLASVGVKNIVPTDICTLEDERFYSHRGRIQHGAKVSGRFAGFISQH